MSDDVILETAASWHVRQGADDMDWLAFEAWLEADPRHRGAFDDVAMLDFDIDHHRDRLRQVQSSIAPVDRAQRWWRPLLLASGAVAAVGVVTVVARQPDSSEPRATGIASSYQATATSRDVRVAGAGITLAPGSGIKVHDDDAPRIALTGRAVFAVRHDPARTLTVRAAGYAIRDVGTRFEVVAGAGTIRVRVAEGELAIHAVAADHGEVRVRAGQMATGLADGTITMAASTTAALDGWRNGPLVYDAMPLGLVIADVARATGRPVRADSAVAQRPFSGVLAQGDSAAMIDTLATLAGLEARRRGETIYLGDRVRR
ncbi:FecR family protein [Sphingomonas oligophenolica]|uniref:DUF4880 domain-containing protein n=1 Tax=Sphingomonas oligophenolica TaxID=301154 RepID=A0A502C1R0_9SPHN|nr:FecR domain-containing protein [Sphingomonas oligophenolica]TPG06019.1 DUF4880 domain-containing protein [Sphingomonas oligophenolica]